MRPNRPPERRCLGGSATAWEVIAHIKVSTSRTQIVAGSKMLHHLLPDLIPPIDRRYTFRFFTGQMMIASDRVAFLSWLCCGQEYGRFVGDETLRHICRQKIASSDYEAASLVLRHGGDLGLPVADPLSFIGIGHPRFAASSIRSLSATCSSAGMP